MLAITSKMSRIRTNAHRANTGPNRSRGHPDAGSFRSRFVARCCASEPDATPFQPSAFTEWFANLFKHNGVGERDFLCSQYGDTVATSNPCDAVLLRRSAYSTSAITPR